jgi:hypothetical protein
VPEDEDADRKAFWLAAREAFIEKGPRYIICVIGDECEIKLNYLNKEVFQKQSTLSVVAAFGELDKYARLEKDQIVLAPEKILEVKVYTFKLRLSDKNGNWETIEVKCAINKPFVLPSGVDGLLGSDGVGGSTTILPGSGTKGTALPIDDETTIDSSAVAEDSTTE